MASLVMPELYHKDPPSGSHIEILNHKHLEKVLELQENVAASMPEDLFQCDDASFYSELFEGKGRILGLFNHKKLMACSVISLPGSRSPDNLGKHINLENKQLELVVNLEAAYVHPSCQGQGIAALLSAMQLDFAARLGKQHALSTVSPANFYSLKNLFSLQFSIRNICQKYGNKTRYIMYKQLLKSNVIYKAGSSSRGQWTPSADFSAQKELLKEEYRGVNIKGTIEDFLIYYHK